MPRPATLGRFALPILFGLLACPASNAAIQPAGQAREASAELHGFYRPLRHNPMA